MTTREEVFDEASPVINDIYDFGNLNSTSENVVSSDANKLYPDDYGRECQEEEEDPDEVHILTSTQMQKQIDNRRYVEENDGGIFNDEKDFDSNLQTQVNDSHTKSQRNDYEGAENITEIMDEMNINDYGAQQINVPKLDETFKGKNKSKNPYLNPMCEPVILAGKTTIGLSQAKLYGLLDKQGQVKLSPPPKQKVASRDKVANLSQPRKYEKQSDLVIFDEEEERRHLMAKRKAEMAMRNPRCGYDFVDRMKERGDFIDRLNQGSEGKVSKSIFEKLKQDYEAKHDKLNCPKCERLQSFDEFYEKKRNCTLCNVKFVKRSVCNTASFLKRMNNKQEEREAKLALLDAKVYANMPKSSSSSSKNAKKISFVKEPPNNVEQTNMGSSKAQLCREKKENERQTLPIVRRPKSATVGGMTVPNNVFMKRKSQENLSATIQPLVNEKDVFAPDHIQEAHNHVGDAMKNMVQSHLQRSADIAAMVNQANEMYLTENKQNTSNRKRDTRTAQNKSANSGRNSRKNITKVGRPDSSKQIASEKFNRLLECED